MLTAIRRMVFAGNWVVWCGVVATGVLVGGIAAGGRILELGALAFLVVTLFVIVRPVLGAVIVLGFAFINPSLLPPLVEIGEFTVRYVDVFIALLTIAVLIRLFINNRIYWREWQFITKPLFPFLIYIGLSLLLVWLYVPSHAHASFASYTRLVVTMIYGWLLFNSLCTIGDLRFLVKSIVVLAAVTIGIGIWEYWHMAGEAPTRIGGLLGFNSFGQVSGLSILWGFLSRQRKVPILSWMASIALGIIGLLLSRSTSSILATAGALSIAWVVYERKRIIQGIIMIRVILVGILTFTLAGLAVWYLRREDVLALLDLTGGSFAQRLMLAYMGILIWLEHPVFGTGWQATATEAFVGNPELNAVLMEVFPILPRHYFFLEQPTSLHNMYVQIFAELGFVGFLLFVYGVFLVGRRITFILKGLQPSPLKRWGQFVALGLVYLLFWWNTNPLYGGQSESILAIVFLSLLAALWRFEKNS